MAQHKLVDPERLFDDWKRRSIQKYTGLLILKWLDGNIINVREEYSIEIPEDIENQWEESIKHFKGHQKGYKICGKLSASVFHGVPKKVCIERSIPMEKFYLDEERK